jgi:glycosyltransferase involved in cell wall biosynthesis
VRLAIIHYHLNRGGVTQVIASHLRALDRALPAGQQMPVAVVFGGRCQGWPSELPEQLSRLQVSLLPVPELDYDEIRPREADLASQLLAALTQADFGPGQTVLHVHNHALGKNVDLPLAVRRMAWEGYGLLLQIHDFVEDFRPQSYRRLLAATAARDPQARSGRLYPQATHVHYAVLNGRDRRVLTRAGVDAGRLHLLPNAVAGVGTLPSRGGARSRLAERFGVPEDHRFVLYPVRGIRRKNVGEALLWSALSPAKTSFGMTLAPINPVERSSYERWKEVAQSCGLPWVFEVGDVGGLAYGESLAAADRLLTTSLAEGFGLVFLESWLSGRCLVGRNLPEITADFVAAGARFPGLQDQLPVPLPWLPEVEWRHEIGRAYRDVLRSYGQPEPPGRELQRDISALVRDGHVDFAACTRRAQRRVIELAVADSAARDHLLRAQPGIAEGLSARAPDRALIDHNVQVVRQHYSLERCGTRLLDLYERVGAEGTGGRLEPLAGADRILSSFLELSKFHPLRVEP